jgi:hypothetical protein
MTNFILKTKKCVMLDRPIPDLMLSSVWCLALVLRNFSRLIMTPGRVVVLATPFAISLASRPVIASSELEGLGKIAISDLLIRPEIAHRENRTGGFSIGESQLGFRWTFDSLISADVRLGSQSLLGAPLKYTIMSAATAGSDQLAVIEGYGSWKMNLGRLRLGRIPIPFGVESAIKSDSTLVMPRSYIFSKGIIGLRDDGLLFDVDMNGFYSKWAIHNGESGATTDSEHWLTVQAGWCGGAQLCLSASGQAGRTNPTSTNPGLAVPSADQIRQLGINPSVASRQRLAVGSIDWRDRYGGVVLESLIGESEQNTLGVTDRGKISTTHLDAWLQVVPQVFALARFQTLDPRQDRGGDRVEEGVLGGSIRNFYGTGSLSFFVARKIDEQVVGVQHEFRIVLSMTPSIDDLQPWSIH